MKYFNYISLLLIISVCYSCQNDDYEADIIIQNEILTEKSSSSHAQRVTSDELEIQLQWISFLSAKAIHDDSDAEEFLLELLNSTMSTGNSSVLKLNDLLSTSIANNSFEKAFKSAFLYYFYPSSSCPNDDRVPRGGPKPPGTIGGCAEEICPEIYYQQYLDFIKQEHCLELYLPNGYDETDRLINTTSHPLTNFGGNEAYVIPEDCDNRLYISPFNLHILNNVFVVRPYRNSVTRCSYTEFSYIEDFTTFLAI